VDVSKRRLSFGLKPSYFAGEEGQDRPVPESTDMLDDGDDEAVGDHVPEDASKDGISDSEDDNDHESIQIDMDVQSHLPIPQADFVEARTDAPALAPLKLQGGFQWAGIDMQLEAERGSDSSSDEEMEPSKKRKKRHRKEIEQDFTADMHTKTPESNADFERLLLGSPNSSYLWVQYMSFQLQISEVERAREIGRRALQVIHFREEQEKLNVWIALLNLENVYGTEESLEAMFKDAARQNDSKTVHLRLASIFDQTEKYEVGTLLFHPFTFLTSDTES
jgi:rRNA biogenesis protein RRP5